MSLLKSEIICKTCDTQYILVYQEDDAQNITCCPFCASPIEAATDTDGEEE